MKPSGRNLNLTSYDEIFQTEENRVEATQEKVIDIPLTQLHPFKNHPFKVTDPVQWVMGNMVQQDLLPKMKSKTPTNTFPLSQRNGEGV